MSRRIYTRNDKFFYMYDDATSVMISENLQTPVTTIDGKAVNFMRAGSCICLLCQYLRTDTGPLNVLLACYRDQDTAARNILHIQTIKKHAANENRLHKIRMEYDEYKNFFQQWQQEYRSALERQRSSLRAS